MKDIYIEIRKGVGGDESSLFVKDIFQMYISFFRRLKKEIKITFIEKENNGLRNAIIFVKRINIKLLKKENGVHRVQRVPFTESNGRIHTSTCTVKVFIKENKTSVKVKKKDLYITTFKASGAGGQHVNKTNSAVRVKHIPTGIVVECQSERSQIKNKETAIELLNLKIKDNINKEKNSMKKINRNISKLNSNRTNKIRTYDFKNKVVINHINNKKVSFLNKILYKGRIDLIV